MNNKKFIIIIPARFNSKRLPGKPLLDINGKPMIAYVVKKALESEADRVIVATEHQKVADTAISIGVEVCLTSLAHNTGIERIAEVIEYCNIPNDTIIVNLQCDEPLISSSMIKQIVEDLIHNTASIATMAAPIKNIKDIYNHNVVKVIRDVHGFAIYFSRTPIPWSKHTHLNDYRRNNSDIKNNIFLRHIGIYVYKAEFIRYYTNLVSSPIEQLELLEQLRILWYGKKVYVSLTSEVSSFGIDTKSDLYKARKFLLNKVKI